MAEPVYTHERLSSGAPLPETSNRVFGLIFAAVFTVIALLHLFVRDKDWWWYFAVIAAAFLLPALVKPGLLGPLHRVWQQVRLILNRIIAFLVMVVLFYGVVLPTGLIMRALGKDLLRLRYDRDAASYWLPRDPPGPEPETMQNQF